MVWPCERWFFGRQHADIYEWISNSDVMRSSNRVHSNFFNHNCQQWGLWLLASMCVCVEYDNFTIRIVRICLCADDMYCKRAFYISFGSNLSIPPLSFRPNYYVFFVSACLMVNTTQVKWRRSCKTRVLFAAQRIQLVAVKKVITRNGRRRRTGKQVLMKSIAFH